MWDMSLGYGADILGTLNYYAIGDPLNLIYVFANKYNAEYFYDFMMIFRLYLVGVAFISFGTYLKKDGNGILIGSFVYIFCGTVFAAGIRHPFFLNPMIYLPLLLMGVEKVYRKEKPYLFTIMVTIAAISNFYFFYMLTIAAVVYALIRFPEYKEDGFFKTLGRFSGWYILGIGISAVILLPVVIAFSGNARTASDINYFTIFLYKKSYYKALLLQFIGFEKIYKGTDLNYLAIAYCAVITLFLSKRKKHMAYKVAVLIGGISLLSPIGAYILHGLSYPMNRWLFIFSFIIGMSVMEVYEELFELSRIQKIGIVLGTLFYIALSMIKADSKTKTGLALIILILTVIVLFGMNEIKVIRQSKYKNFVIYGLLIISVGISSYVHYSPRLSKVTKGYVKSGQAYEMLCGKEAKLIGSDEYKLKGNIYRTESLEKKVPNWGLNEKIAGITNYYSITDKNVSDTIQQFGLKSYQYKFKFRKLDMRQGLMNLYGVKYLICTKENGEKLSSNYKLLKSKDGMKLYENKNVFPFGYTYDKYITKEQYDALNPLEKEQTLLQRVVLEETPKKNENIQQQKVPDQTKTYELGKNYYVHNKKGKGKTLKIKIPKNYLKENSYIYLCGVTTEALVGKSSKHILGVGKNKTGFNLTYGGKMVHLYNAEKNSSYDIGKRDYLIKMSEKGIRSKDDTLILSFKLKDDYYIDKISIIEGNKKVEKRYIEERKTEDHLSDISYDGGNHFKAKIKAGKDEMLCIPIPYHKGFKAFDNGKLVKIRKVNGMFQGIYLSKGNHNIRLNYETPGLKIGAIISIASVIVLLGISKKKKYK